MTYRLVKRGMDIVVSSIALVATSPIQIVTAVLVRCRLGSPILFVQPRPGQGERIFPLYKFRTMRSADKAAGLISDEDRMTRLGSFLRATSLDELPTLWNVLRGDMSLVGPRPLLVQYLDRYSPEQRRRHQVRPGITGLAQVRGRNALSWNQKFHLDVQYIETMSLKLDLTILCRTIGVVILRAGITDASTPTMSEFREASEREK